MSDIISETLARSGVSITITSLSDFVAFLVGLTTGFKSVQIFCVYAGFAIAFCYFYQITFFSGFLCLHTNRILNKNNSFLFCVKQEKIKMVFCCSQSNSESETNQNGLELTQLNSNIKQVVRKNSKFQKASSLWIRKLKQGCLDIIKFLICSKKGKCLSVGLFIIYLSLSIWGASQIHEGIKLSNLVSESSYYSKYIRDNTELVDLNPIVMFVIYEPIDYDNLQNRIKIKNLFNDAFKINGISKNFNLNWLNSFLSKKIKYKHNIDNLLSVINDYPPFINDIIIHKTEFDPLLNITHKSVFKYRHSENDETKSIKNREKKV